MSPKDFKITCLKCGKEKPRKEFQRDSKEYRSCNNCVYGAQMRIDEAYKSAFELFNTYL